MPGSFRSWALVLTCLASIVTTGPRCIRAQDTPQPSQATTESSPLLATSIRFFNRVVPNVIRGTMPKVGSTFKIAMRS